MELKKEISDSTAIYIFRIFLIIIYSLIAFSLVLKQHSGNMENPVFKSAAIIFLLVALSAALPLTRLFLSYKNRYFMENAFIATSIVIILMLYTYIYYTCDISLSPKLFYSSLITSIVMQLPLIFLVNKIHKGPGKNENTAR